jgi:hypothetical protein
MAARVMMPEQLKEFRALLYEWRQQNPHRKSVSFTRLDTILELLEADSALKKETQPGGLFAPISEATRAVDEIRFAAERAMYLLNRMQSTLNVQILTAYHDLASQREVKQLLSDISGFRETVERLPAQISEEGKKIIQDLESQEETIRNVIGDIRGMMKDGNDVLSLVNETTKSVDSTAARIDSIIRAPSSLARPFDIMDYYNTVVAASDATKQANSLLDSVDEFLGAAKWEERMPMVLKLADSMASEGKGIITHAFILGAALIAVFFLCLLSYRYAAKRL